MTRLATGRQTLQRPASAREASSSCVTGTSRRVPRPRLHESLGPSLLAAPTPPGPRVATASQAARPHRRPGAARADALCVSVPRPRTRPDRSGRAPAPRRPGEGGGSREEVPALPGRSLVFTFKNMVLLADNRKKPKNYRKVQNL